MVVPNENLNNSKRLNELHKKRHEKIVKHIHQRIKHGHDILKIKDFLRGSGVLEHEIEHAFERVYHELEDKAQVKRLFISSLRPTIAKMVLPFLVVVILLLHLFANIYNIPDLGKDLCETSKVTQSMYDLTSSDSLSPDLKSNLISLQKDNLDIQFNLINRYKKLFLADFPLIFTKLYKLDPYFPVPCETLSILESDNCRYYMLESDYNCINEFVLVNDGKDSNIENIFLGQPPEYKQIRLSGVLFHCIILCLEIYLISCLIYFVHEKIRSKLTRKTRDILEVTFIIAAVFAVILAIYLYIYMLKIITLSV